MASRRVTVTERDLRAAMAAYADAALGTHDVPSCGAVGNRAKTRCPFCHGPYTQRGEVRVCLPCRRKNNAARRRRWLLNPAHRLRGLAASKRWRDRERAKRET